MKYILLSVLVVSLIGFVMITNAYGFEYDYYDGFYVTYGNCDVNVESNVLINVGCTIAHDSSVGKHTFLSPRVSIAGFVNVGDRCNIGINATIIDNISIMNNVQIGGGAVVISHVKKEGLYVGNPARFIR